MKRFSYLGDRLFLSAVGLYVLNRWGLKPHVSSPFLHGQWNDLLLIPAALPMVLWLHRQLGLRDGDEPPSAGEVGWHLAAWSVICEGIGPAVFHRGTADPLDLAAYAVGALGAWCWWNRSKLNRAFSPGREL